MRLTVGPLPSAVYWRRRAVVLGALLLFLIVLVYSCSGPSDSGEKPRAAGSPSPSATPTLGEPSPSTSAATPEAGDASGGAPASGGGQQQDQPASGGPVIDIPPAAAPGPGSCTDAEMSLIALASPTRVKRGDPVSLGLKIKNISDRTCSRDVGPNPQELFIKIGAQKVWSSDTCGTGRGSDVRSFPPNQENQYGLDWNGQTSTTCGGGVATGPDPDPGEYQVFARLGTKLSEPVKLIITS